MIMRAEHAWVVRNPISALPVAAAKGEGQYACGTGLGGLPRAVDTQ